MFITALFIKARKQKQPKCPSTDVQINKMWYILTMEYYSAIKRNEILTHATIWIDLENIMLSERNQTQKATYCIIPFTGNVQNRQICRDGKQISGCQWVERKGNWEVWGFFLG